MNIDKVSYQYDCSDIGWSQVSSMFEIVGWGYRSDDKVKASFERSSHVCFVKTDNKIIAFGRTIDDGIYYGHIVDVVVHPDYQKQGLGTKIVEYLRSQMKGYNFITLTAAPGKSEFYEKIGWKKQKTAYLWPKDSEQREQHCFDS